MNVSRSALLPYTVEQMYGVIADVQAYPDFLNWCNGVEVKESQVDEVIAKLLISYGKLALNFTTRNKMVENESVSMSLVEGPFSKLSGDWALQALTDSACKVTLNMDFNFENPITQKLFGGVFQKVIAAQLDAFQQRAEDLYGV